MDMTEIFLGQVMPTAFNFAPRGFALCNGQLMAIAQNQALFSLLGTTYGGDGRTTFALPDLRGRTPIGMGPANPIGQTGGEESVTLTTNEMPAHTHGFNGTTANGTTRNPSNGLLGTTAVNLYAHNDVAQVPLAAQTVAASGNSQPHENMQPFRVINYCIALSGIFPSRN
jgi:microcystin-dependent protein